MSAKSRRDYLEVMHKPYQRACRKERRTLLDKMEQVIRLARNTPIQLMGTYE